MLSLATAIRNRGHPHSPDEADAGSGSEGDKTHWVPLGTLLARRLGIAETSPEGLRKIIAFCTTFVSMVSRHSPKLQPPFMLSPLSCSFPMGHLLISWGDPPKIRSQCFIDSRHQNKMPHSPALPWSPPSSPRMRLTSTTRASPWWDSPLRATPLLK